MKTFLRSFRSSISYQHLQLTNTFTSFTNTSIQIKPRLNNTHTTLTQFKSLISFIYHFNKQVFQICISTQRWTNTSSVSLLYNTTQFPFNMFTHLMEKVGMVLWLNISAPPWWRSLDPVNAIIRPGDATTLMPHRSIKNWDAFGKLTELIWLIV